MKQHSTQNKHRTITDYIKTRYGEIANQGATTGCCGGTSACCGPQATDTTQITEMLGYSESDASGSWEGANLGLGCGNPLAHAALQAGETVLDLGSGGGFDCFIARRQVTALGHVIGVDLTPAMIDLARTNAKRLGYTYVEFIEGAIEDLPVADAAVDVVISNCVINLSLEKQQVFKEAFRVLKPGGRLAVADLLATAELPEEIRSDLRLLAGCVAGAEHVAVVEQLLVNAGFVGIQLKAKESSREIVATWVPGLDLSRYVASYVIQAEKPR